MLIRRHKKTGAKNNADKLGFPPNLRRLKAQSLLEYLTLIGIISGVIVLMSSYIQRGIQGMVRTVADQVGNQAASDQKRDQFGFLINSTDNRFVRSSKRDRERIGVFNYIYNDEGTAQGFLLTNLGFTEREEQ